MPEDVGRFALALALLAGVCLVVLTIARVPVRRDAVVAIVRAAIQLSLVALIIAWVFSHPEAAGLYLAVMLGVAAMTSARRIRCGTHQIPSLALAIGLGALCALVPILAVGASVPASHRWGTHPSTRPDPKRRARGPAGSVRRAAARWGFAR